MKKIDSSYLKSIVYVTNSSDLTRLFPSRGGKGHVSKDFQCDKDYISLDYLDIEFYSVYLYSNDEISPDDPDCEEKKLWLF